MVNKMTQPDNASHIMRIPPKHPPRRHSAPAKTAKGNTEGILVNEPKPAGAGGNSNPPVVYTWQDGLGWFFKALWKEISEGVHTGLDAGGAIPVVGAAFDGLNGAIYAAEGDAVNASVSFASVALDLVPGAGTAAKGAKFAYKAGSGLAKSAVKSVGKNILKQAGENAAEQVIKQTVRATGEQAVKQTVRATGEQAVKQTVRATGEQGVKQTVRATEKQAVNATEKAVAKTSEKETVKASEKAAKESDGIAVKESKKEHSPLKSCPKTGHPVNPVLGIKFLAEETELDFTLPAVLPLRWQRSYFSDQAGSGWLGQGWSLPFSRHLLRREDGMLLIDEQGREVALPSPQAGESRFDRHEQIFFTREANGRYCITALNNRLRYIYAPLALNHDDPQGRAAPYLPLIAMEDPYGNHIRICYDETGLPVEVYDAAGRRLSLRFTTLRLPDGSETRRLQYVVLHVADRAPELLVSYHYSAEGDLISVQNAQGVVRREYRYTQHILTEHRQPGGLIARYEYDEYTRKGKVIRHTTNLGQTWLFDYRKGETRVTDPLQRVTRYRYNTGRQFTGFVDAGGRQHQAMLDSAGRPVTFTLPGGLLTHYRYDHFGNITSITDPAGYRTAIRYDSAHRPIAVTDVMGHTTKFDYAPAGDAMRIVDAQGNATQYRYEPRGLLAEVESSDGRSRFMEYDDTGQLTAFTDCSGFTTRLSRDAKGNVQAIVYPDGSQTSFLYDERANLLATRFADGSTEQYSRDASGRQTGYRDALGAQTTWQLDPDGLPGSRTDAYGNRFHYEYDAARRLVCLTNENGACYRMTYDENDNILCEQSFDGAVTHYRYDDAGQLIEKTEAGTPAGARRDGAMAAGINTVYRRDAAGRVTEKIVRDVASGATSRSRYEYNAAGQLTRAENAQCVIERSYDRLGQWVSETCEVMGQRYTLQHAYGSSGSRSRTTLPDGSQLNYLCYGAGHLLQINLDTAILCEFERDSLHRETRRTQGALTSAFRYSVRGQLQSQQVSAGDCATDFTPPVISRHYRYDKAGNLQKVTGPRGHQTEYRYDLLGRLIQQGEERFAYDAAHNLVDPGSPGIIDNRLDRYQGHRYRWGSYGNLQEKAAESGERLRLSYTPEHQLERAETERNGNRQATEYGYDALGRRIYKKNAGGTVIFLWDGDQLLSEIGTEKTLTWVYAPDSFVPLAQIARKENAETKIYYYHTDQIGCPRELTTAEGEIVWQAHYRAWGNLATQEAAAQPGSEQVIQPLRFQGQYYDEESGLHYNRYRYYDPDTGRFITPDPLGLTGGENAWLYAPNPTGWIDPLGLMNNPGSSSSAGGLTRGNAGNLGKATYSFDKITKNMTVTTHGAPFVTQTDRLASGSTLAKQVKGAVAKQGGNVNRVVLQSCYSARGGAASQAQQLANALNKPVTGFKGKFTQEIRAGSSRPKDGSGGQTKLFQPSTSNIGKTTSSVLNNVGNKIVSGAVKTKQFFKNTP
ncbi:RHS repeat-associated core domain-containing protein [Pantoea sp.]|uniref:RHS repeat-associated core domain-containing protein n=1 Tax=Pantoea sp. TaxID=69393 RepID=UPI00289EDC49|nr:RHS repeat-associated core domain-containing protein [Pantoea sp.]